MLQKFFLYSGILSIVLFIGGLFFFSENKTVYREEKVPSQIFRAPQKVTMLVFGDVMLDRSVRKYIDQYGTAKLFEYIEEDITSADITLINLEGPITTQNSVVSKENLQFTFAPHTATDLKNVGIDVVSLANNHTDNFGIKGLEETKMFLENAGIVYFGSPSNRKDDIVKSFQIGSTTFSFVGYHQFQNPTFDQVGEIIKKEKQKENIVIFYPHWGIEYEKIAGEKERAIARLAIDSNADIVVGAHPHVVQNMEFYNSKPIFYSLGNFIFDQWFTPDVQEGLALLLTFFDGNMISIELKPFIRERFQPKWLEGEKKINWCKRYTNSVSLTQGERDSCILNVKAV